MNSELNSRIASYRGAEQRDDEHIYYEASMTGGVIAAYHRHLSTDIKKKKYKIKTSFVSPEGPKVLAK